MSTRLPIYLDHAATTPLDARVAAVMAECLTMEGAFGNPASVHHYGREAHERVEQARSQVARLIGARAADVVFTSGATESNNLAILGTVRGSTQGAMGADAPRAHVVTVRSEHRSVLDACQQLEREGHEVSYLAPDAQGLIAPAQIALALRPQTRLVSIMHANNEIGVLQDLAAIALICRARGVALHVDAAQSAGKVPLDVATLGADLLSFTAHKLYGPKGIGALWVAPAQRARLQPLQFGGGQERGVRSGTLAVHQIVGFGRACEIAGAQLPDDSSRLMRLTEALWQGLADLPGALRNGHAQQRVPGLLSVSVEGVEGESLLAGLSELALSSGSACDSDTDEPSHVLRSLGRSRELAQSTLRLSLGRGTDEAQVQGAIQAIRREVLRLRAAAFVSADPQASRAAGDAAPEPDASDPLGVRVRALFADLSHAGDLRDGEATAQRAPEWVLRGEGGSQAEGTQVRFALRVADGRVREVRYRAYGCPYTLASCEWLARRLTGAALPAGAPAAILAAVAGVPTDWAAALGIPPGKLGQLLVIEDVLRSAVVHRSVPPGTDHRDL